MQAGILNGNGGKIGNGRKDALILLSKLTLSHTVEQLDNADNTIIGDQRHTDNRPSDETDLFVDPAGKTGLLTDIRDQHRDTILGDPAGHPLAGLQATAGQTVRNGRNNDFKAEFPGFLIDNQQ